jgi:signal transduction histidine kinase
MTSGPSGERRDEVPGTLSALEDILVTAELSGRALRAADYRAENTALASLAEALAQDPKSIHQRLVDAALALTGAGSAGLSLLDADPKEPVFRWIATAGGFAEYLGTTMPRDFSPCGLVVSANSAILMRDPVRVFSYIQALKLPLFEVLLVPFRQGVRAIGTVWVATHSKDKLFDAEDLRVVEGLAVFAGAASNNMRLVDELERANRQKDVFLASVAHELRNPLSPITQAAAVAASANISAPQRQWALEVIVRQARTMTLLLDDLLDASSIARGRLQLHPESIDLSSLVEAAIETARPRIDAKGHTLTVELHPEKIELIADRLRFCQILSNLLTNAAKFTPPGGNITLRAESDESWLTLRVRDTGIGLTPESILRIFDMFSQVTSTHDRSDEGLGIGLALAKGFAELHGGTLQVESEGLGEGAEFILRVPSRRSEARDCNSVSASE